MKYNRRWTVACPRCSQVLNSENFKCRNCEKGNILAAENMGTVMLGCGYCMVPLQLLFKCPSCDALISTNLVRTGDATAVATPPQPAGSLKFGGVAIIMAIIIVIWFLVAHIHL